MWWQTSSGVSLACVAFVLPGFPGVWKAKSPQRVLRGRETGVEGGERAARAPPRGRFVVSGPHMVLRLMDRWMSAFE